MKCSIAQNVGVDISKDSLDVALHPGGVIARFANDPEGHRALMKWLGGYESLRIVFEATGAYHHQFERTLAEAGWPMDKVNPRQARRFAEAVGKLAKTDRCDAIMLANMGAALDLAPRPIGSQNLDDMTELLNARDALIKDRVAALNRQKNARSPLIKRHIAARLRQNEAIDKQQENLRSADSSIDERFEVLTSIPGFGDVTANALIFEMPELGDLDQGQAASLAGLAPVAKDSGQSKSNDHSRRSLPSAPGPLHASPHRHHAKAPHPRRRAPAR
jgi:transposase